MGESRFLRRRYRAIGSHVATILGLVGLLMLVPLLAILAWPDEGRHGAAFLVPALAFAAGGFGLARLLDPGDDAVSVGEGVVVVLLGWLVAAVAGAVPLMQLESLDFSQAVFESVSGWTTTGLSVVDLGRAHPMTLLWRSVMQLAGGAGFAILMVAAIMRTGAPSVSAAEGRSEQLVPNVRSSARLVLRIYAGYTVLGVVGLVAAGMGWFDAINHAFCAVSTGGFGTRLESIGFWDSPAIESVTLVLMVLGNLDFVTAWLLLRGRLRAVGRNGEVRVMAVAAPVAVALVMWVTTAPLFASTSKAFRVALFETVSALTTTGYSTVGYGDWDGFGVLLLVALMLIGGGTCSTAGGLKQQRVYLLYRSVVREMRRWLLPRGAVQDDSVWEGEQRVALGADRIRDVGTFTFLYLGTWLAGAAILAAHGYGMRESLFEFASALGTVGLSIGVTGTGTPAGVLWTETAAMLLGRLEFFVVLAGGARLLRDVWRMVGPLRRHSQTPNSQ